MHTPDDGETAVVDVGCVDGSGHRNGPALRFVAGEPYSFASFDHGAIDGSAVIWGDEGNIQMLQHSSHGRPSGATVIFSPQGNLEWTITLDAHSGRSTQYTWYPGGGPRSLYHTTLDAKTGRPTAKLVGTYWIRDEEGALLVQGQFRDGVRIGGWRCRPSSTETFETTTFPGGTETRRVVDCLKHVNASISGSFDQVAVFKAPDP